MESHNLEVSASNPPKPKTYSKTRDQIILRHPRNRTIQASAERITTTTTSLSSPSPNLQSSSSPEIRKARIRQNLPWVGVQNYPRIFSMSCLNFSSSEAPFQRLANQLPGS